MGPVNTYDVTPELAAAIARVQPAGWTWRQVEDADGPSSTKMGQLLTGAGRVRSDVLRRLDDVFGWEPGTALALVSANQRTRRGALTRATVGPPRQGSSIARVGGRGEGDLADSEREIVGEAAKLLAQSAEMAAKAAEITAQAAVMLAKVATRTE